jgi:CubicO group peptidase (beta-lactamase class C family)
MKLFYCILISFVFASCSPKMETRKIYPIDTVIENHMKSFGIVGLGAAIILDKKLVWSKGYGYADKQKKLPFTPNTILNIASITKTITGACLMHVVEEGKVSLDEDINQYLPFKAINPNYPSEKITLRNLATHTSGITDRSPVYDDSYHYGGDSPEPLGDFLKNYFSPEGKYYSKDNFIKFKPGSHKHYSNIGAGLAGYIIELKTGEKLNEYSKRIIFEPLKMKDTGWLLTEVKLENHSKLYTQERDSIESVPLYGLTTYPDGGVRTSVSDLSRFFICLLNDAELDGTRILKKESVEEMKRPQFGERIKPDSIDFAKKNAGIFWGIENGSMVGHSGGDPGVMTGMHYDNSKKIGVILFINTMPKEGRKAFEFFDKEFWDFASKLRATEK